MDSHGSAHYAVAFTHTCLTCSQAKGGDSKEPTLTRAEHNWTTNREEQFQLLPVSHVLLNFGEVPSVRMTSSSWSSTEQIWSTMMRLSAASARVKKVTAPEPLLADFMKRRRFRDERQNVRNEEVGRFPGRSLLLFLPTSSSLVLTETLMENQQRLPSQKQQTCYSHDSALLRRWLSASYNKTPLSFVFHSRKTTSITNSSSAISEHISGRGSADPPALIFLFAPRKKSWFKGFLTNDS